MFVCRPTLVSGWLSTQTSILMLVTYNCWDPLTPHFHSLCIWSLNKRQVYIIGYTFLTLGVLVPVWLHHVSLISCTKTTLLCCWKLNLTCVSMLFIFINQTTSCSAFMSLWLKKIWYCSAGWVMSLGSYVWYLAPHFHVHTCEQTELTLVSAVSVGSSYVGLLSKLDGSRV